MLADINAHPRDQRIKFFEADHRYEIDGQVYTSVTTLVKKFFPEFNADEAIKKMGPKHPLFGKPPEEIKAMWEDKRDKASAAGTEMHREIEVFLNTGEMGSTVEFQYFYKIYASRAKGKPFRTEWTIFDEETGIAGTIDYIYTQGDQYCMMDWKRSKAIKKENRYGTGFAPIAHLQDCNYNHYCLQQNIYAAILEKHYGIRVASMMLARIYGETFEPVRIPRMEKEAKMLLDYAKEQFCVAQQSAVSN